jgi:uncharacterized protein (TIGR03118 family)
MFRSIRSAVSICALSAGALTAVVVGGAERAPLNFYQQRNLVSDGSVPAEHTDASLINAWGLAFNPTGVWWVANAGSGIATLYDGNGIKNALSVTVPPVPGETGPSHPTGLVFYGGQGFRVSDGVNSAPARFIFSTVEGTIAAWAPTVPPPAPSHNAFTMVPSDGAFYTGLAIGNNGSGDFIYVPDFRGRKIDVYDSTFSEVKTNGAFTDPGLPAEYAPFGIRNINDVLYVTYVVPNDTVTGIVAGNGLGIVDAYDLNGTFLRRLITGGELNGPWGLALAPDDFGKFSGALLVGNLGNGRIHAYDPITGQPRGTLLGPTGGPIEIERLWALNFGNGNVAGPTNVLFFTAGLENEQHGLFGSITAVAPGNGRRDD